MNDYTYTNDATTETPSLDDLLRTCEDRRQRRRDYVLALLATGNKLAAALLLIAENPTRYCVVVEDEAARKTTLDAIRLTMDGMDFPDRSAEVQIQVSAATEHGEIYILDTDALKLQLWYGGKPRWV
jgi:hypothetical protein